MIVLDASAVLELVLHTAAGREVASRIGAPEVSLHAPELLDLEVAQALRHYLRTGEIGEACAEAALEALVDLDLARYSHGPLLPRVWALRENLTAYDAAYVALAEALGGPLVTCDRRLAASAGGSARIETVARR